MPPCLVHCWCVWALSDNLFHQCSILILIWMVLGVLHCPLGDQHPICYTSRSAPPPQILNSFFDVAFWAPISPKWCSKVNIVRIWEAKGSILAPMFEPFLGSIFALPSGPSPIAPRDEITLRGQPPHFH